MRHITGVGLGIVYGFDLYNAILNLEKNVKNLLKKLRKMCETNLKSPEKCVRINIMSWRMVSEENLI